MDRVLLRTALVVGLIPNVSFSLTNLDTQPFAAILGLACILSFSSARFPTLIWCLLIPAAAAAATALISGGMTDGARSVVTYVSPWIFACTAYLAYRRGIAIHRYLLFMLYLWAAAGMIQWLIDPRIFEFLVNTRTSTDRGVTGLAPEPSFYGLTIIQMWLTLLLLRPDIARKWHVVLLCVFQVLILAKSMLAILVVLLLAALFAVRSIWWLAAILVGLFAALVGVTEGMDGQSRPAVLLTILLENPSQVLYLDASISERFFHLYLSFERALSSGLLPHGISAFGEVIEQGQKEHAAFWWGEPQNKILSGAGSAVFELGWFALIYVFVFWRCLNQDRQIHQFHKLVLGFGIVFVYLNTVTLASPYFGLMIGIMAAHSVHSAHWGRTALARKQHVRAGGQAVAL
jgi:hypothetical protein